MEQKIIKVFGIFVMILGVFLVLGAVEPSPEAPIWVLLVYAGLGFAFLFGGYATYLKGGGKPFADHPWPIHF